MARAQRPDNLARGGRGGHHWTSPARRPAAITAGSRAESMRLYVTPGLRPGLEGSRRHPDPGGTPNPGRTPNPDPPLTPGASPGLRDAAHMLNCVAEGLRSP